MLSIGRQSIEFKNPVSIIASYSIVGTKEGEGPLSEYFDRIAVDDLMDKDSWEEAESAFIQGAVNGVLQNVGASPKDVRYLFAGDLLAQSVASSYGLLPFEIPLFGIYGACSTSGEGLSLAAAMVSAEFADMTLAVTSSHFAGAEKEFRYPLDYGSQRPKCATWTVTGSGAFLLSNHLPKGVIAQFKNCKITGITTGKIVDYGLKDSMNMGCCMSPAAADIIECHLNDFGRKPENYDKIITGDLGTVGQTALLDLLQEKGFDISGQHMDCGIEIFDAKKQGTDAGGSGCGCAAVTLASYILPKVESGEWKRILFVPTGALLSKVSFNEGQTVPGIAHAVLIEHMEE